MNRRNSPPGTPFCLTVMGQFAQAIVASEVSHNPFTIRTNKPNVEVSWQVTGIRQDAYANAPRGLAFDGTNIWVTNDGSNGVTRMPGN